jgi:hypothetical protein
LLFSHIPSNKYQRPKVYNSSSGNFSRPSSTFYHKAVARYLKLMILYLWLRLIFNPKIYLRIYIVQTYLQDLICQNIWFKLKTLFYRPLSLKPQGITFGTSHDSFNKKFQLILNHCELLTKIIFDFFIIFEKMEKYFSSVIPKWCEIGW